MTVAELYAGVRGKREETTLAAFIAEFEVVELGQEEARLGGLYRRDYGPSHGVGLADAMIAATAELAGAELATLNVKHYPMVRGLRAAYLG